MKETQLSKWLQDLHKRMVSISTNTTELTESKKGKLQEMLVKKMADQNIAHK